MNTLYKENAQDNDETINGMTIEAALKQYEPMVHHFVNSAKTNIVCSAEDLVQEGRMAIVAAFNSYDPARGASFSTWAYHMIKDSILEYQKKNLSILSGGAYLQNIIRKAGEDASVEQIMEFGVSAKTAHAAQYWKTSYSTVEYDSLDNCIAQEGMTDHITDVFAWRQYLNEAEVYALSKYYGFDDERQSVKKIADALGKSPKSVSYLINKALVKLRHVPCVEVYLQ